MRNFKRQKRISGFTLIELLIVIAIILILIGIALPNFLEARIRAQVTKVKGEFRSLETAIEAYAIDWKGQYPPVVCKFWYGEQQNRGGIHLMCNLTTPVAYIKPEAIIGGDLFMSNSETDESGDLLIAPNDSHHYSYGYINIKKYREDSNPPREPAPGPQYGLFSLGPDKLKGPDPRGGGWSNSRYGRNPPAPYFDRHFTAWNYSATNGTRSAGDILRFQFKG